MADWTVNLWPHSDIPKKKLPSVGSALGGAVKNIGKFADQFAYEKYYAPKVKEFVQEQSDKLGIENIQIDPGANVQQQGIGPTGYAGQYPGIDPNAPQPLMTPEQRAIYNALPPKEKLAALKKLVAARNAAGKQQFQRITDGSRTIQTKPGTPRDVTLIEETRGLGEAFGAAESQRAAAEARAADQAAEAMAGRISRFAEERQKAAGEQQLIRDEIAAKEQAVAQSKREFAQAEVNPDRWWQNRSTPNRLMASLAVALGGYAKGLSGGRMENVALRMVNKAIDTDIAQQRNAITKKGKEIQGNENTLAYFVTKLGNAQDAERATREVLNQETQMKLQLTAQQAQSPIIKANAAKTLIAMQRQQAELEAAQRAGEHEQKTISRTSTTRSVPLPRLAPNAVKLDRPDKEVLGRFRNRHSFRSGLDRFWREFKNLKAPIGATKAAGEEADRVNNQKQRLIQRLMVQMSKTELPPKVQELHRNALGSSWQTEGGTKKRIIDIMRDMDEGENADYEVFGQTMNLTRQFPTTKRRRAHQFATYGIQYPGLRVKKKKGK